MTFEVTLTFTELTDSRTILVEDIEFTDGDSVRLQGLDPSLYPSDIVDKFRFFSKNLTAVPKEDTAIESYLVIQTDEDVPTPDVTF